MSDGERRDPRQPRKGHAARCSYKHKYMFIFKFPIYYKYSP